MADPQRPTRRPTTNQPLNAEPRPTFVPMVATLILVAAIVAILAWTISGTSPAGYLGQITGG